MGRIQELMEDPATLQDIFDYVSEGGTIREWCITKGCMHTPIRRWIASDSERKALIDEAHRIRGEVFEEIALKNLRMFNDIDIGAAFDETGNLLPIKDMPEHIRKVITSFEVEMMYEGRGASKQAVGTTKKVRILDALKALELLGKHRKMFVERHEINDKTLESLVAESWGREKDGEAGRGGDGPQEGGGAETVEEPQVP